MALYLAWQHPDRVSRIAVVSPVSQRAHCPFGILSDVAMRVMGTRWFVARALRSAFYDADRATGMVIDEYARPLDRPGRAGRGVLGGVCNVYFSPTYDRMAQSYERLTAPLLQLPDAHVHGGHPRHHLWIFQHMA